MYYIFLTSKDCNCCDEGRKLLEENSLGYREIDLGTPEGKELGLRYNVSSMPAIIDDANKMAFSIGEFSKYQEMINKEY